jgi:hypothetical protein
LLCFSTCDDIFAKIAYGKAQAELTPTLDGQGKRREEKKREEKRRRRRRRRRKRRLVLCPSWAV